MLDRTGVTSTPTPAPPLSRIRSGSRDDAKKVRATLQALLRTRERESEYLERLVDAAKAKGVHLLLEDARGVPFASWEAFVTAPLPWGLGVASTTIDAIIAERNDPQARARALLRADAPGRLLLGQRSRRRAADPALAGTKGPRPGGNGKDYLLARLAKDHRPILEALERGELPSIVAAARAAGIHSRIVQLRPTPESYARSALATLDPTQLGRLLHYLTHPQDVPSPQSRPGNQAGRAPRGRRCAPQEQPEAA